MSPLVQKLESPNVRRIASEPVVRVHIFGGELRLHPGVRVIDLHRHLIAELERIPVAQDGARDVIALDGLHRGAVGSGIVLVRVHVDLPDRIVVRELGEAADVVGVRVGHDEDVDLLNAHGLELRVDLREARGVAAVDHHHQPLGRGVDGAVADVDLVVVCAVCLLQREIAHREAARVVLRVEHGGGIRSVGVGFTCCGVWLPQAVSSASSSAAQHRPPSQRLIFFIYATPYVIGKLLSLSVPPALRRAETGTRGNGASLRSLSSLLFKFPFSGSFYWAGLDRLYSSMAS